MPWGFKDKHIAVEAKRLAQKSLARSDRESSLEELTTRSTNLHDYWIVPNGTITPVTRVVEDGLVKITPGSGQAYLLHRDRRVGSATEGQLIGKINTKGNVTSRLVYNTTTNTYTNNVTQGNVGLEDGTNLQMEDGTILETEEATTATTIIGSQAPLLKAEQDQFGDLYVKDPSPTKQLEKGVIIESDGILPDTAGDVSILELGLSNVAVTSATNGPPPKITLTTTGTSVNNDTYNGWYVVVTSGTGIGQRRKVKDYTGATREIEVDRDWKTIPDDTSTVTLESVRIVKGFWNHAENARKLKKNEEVWMQLIEGDNYQIVSGSDNSVLKAIVNTPGTTLPEDGFWGNNIY